MKSSVTLLATGGTGFVVSHVIRNWLERHDTERALVVDAAPPDAAACRFFAGLNDRIEFVRGNVLDQTLWDALKHRRNIVHVVHGAAVTSINRAMHTEGPDLPGLAGARRAISVNIDGTLNVLQFAAVLPNLARLVNVSSGSVYGNAGPDPLPEDGYVHPDGIYPITKYAAERFTDYAAGDLDVPAVSVRLSGVFGPMDRETPARDVRCAPRIIAEKARAGEPIRVRSFDGAGDFVYAGDVADAIVSLLEAGGLHASVYNVAAGKLTSIAELVDIFRDRLPGLDAVEIKDGEVDIDYPPDQRHGRYGAYDISRIARDTGWRPRPLADTVVDYLDWLNAEK